MAEGVKVFRFDGHVRLSLIILFLQPGMVGLKNVVVSADLWVGTVNGS